MPTPPAGSRVEGKRPRRWGGAGRRPSTSEDVDTLPRGEHSVPDARTAGTAGQPGQGCCLAGQGSGKARPRRGAGAAPVWAWTRSPQTAGSWGLAAHGGRGERGFWVPRPASGLASPAAPDGPSPCVSTGPRAFPQATSMQAAPGACRLVRDPRRRLWAPLSESRPPPHPLSHPAWAWHFPTHQTPAGGSGPAGQPSDEESGL